MTPSRNSVPLIRSVDLEDEYRLHTDNAVNETGDGGTSGDDDDHDDETFQLSASYDIVSVPPNERPIEIGDSVVVDCTELLVDDEEYEDDEERFLPHSDEDVCPNEQGTGETGDLIDEENNLTVVVPEQLNRVEDEIVATSTEQPEESSTLLPAASQVQTLSPSTLISFTN